MIRSMNNHLRKKGDTYHARMKVPEDVRKDFEGKHEFSQTLQTSRKSEALQRASLVIVHWKQQVHEARGRHQSPEDMSPGAWARAWLEDLKKPSVEQDDPRLYAASDDIEKRVNAGLMTLPEAQKALRVVTGTEVLFKTHSEDFLNTYNGKSRSTLSGALNHFIDHFTTPEDITPAALRLWWQSMAMTLSANTMSRVLTAASGFMRYLKDNELVKSPAIHLLKAEGLRTPRIAVKPIPYQPFTIPDCQLLMDAAVKVKDSENMVLLMQVGMYTGARLEEVASIKREDVHMKADWLLIRGTKTSASENREVPIHPALKIILKAALGLHSDSYLIPGLSCDVHGARGNAVGKKFGRLKMSVGFKSRAKVFHSYRKTFVTQMEQAGIPEGVVADIVGHEKNTITYGVYSGGSSMEQKKQAIAILAF